MVVWGQEYKSLNKWSAVMPRNVAVANSAKISLEETIIKNISIYISSFKIRFFYLGCNGLG